VLDSKALFVAGLVFVSACAGNDGSAVVGNSRCALVGAAALSVSDQIGTAMPDKTLSLTFDDGPAEGTADLSSYLQGKGVAATFFINGVYVTGREAVVKQQAADGHLLGNHTHTHRALTELAGGEILDEVEKTDLLLSPMVPKGKLFFRAPFGAWSAAVQGTLSKTAMSKYIGPVGWDIGAALTETTAADWACWDETTGGRTVEECGDLYLREIREKRHGIVLMHDGPPESNSKTLELVQYVLPILQSEGYKFVRLDKVALQDGKAASTDGCGH